MDSQSKSQTRRPQDHTPHSHCQTSATQRKLDELIRSSLRADDNLIAVEQASDQDLQALGILNLADRTRTTGGVAHDPPSATNADQ